MEDSLSLITQKGAAVIAVTAEKSENIDKTIAKTKASYAIVHDDDLKIMKAYDVVYAIRKEMDGKHAMLFWMPHRLQHVMPAHRPYLVHN